MNKINNIDYDKLDKEEMLSNGMEVDRQITSHVHQQLQPRLQVGTIILLCCVGDALHLLDLLIKKIHKMRWELMTYLVHTKIRMGLESFILLYQKLRNISMVKDNIGSTMEEQVEFFLHTIGHNIKN
ncbi:hypothetical protein CR513_20458, partial [Mucuna pruriens]